MNYADLITQIQSLCNRNDASFIGEIPNFITRAIFSIYSKTRTIGFQVFQPGNPTFTVNSPFITRPDDWQETISLSYVIPGATPTRVYVLSRSYEFCQTYSPIENVTGDPIFYADYDLPTPGVGRIFLSPTPAVAYPYELIYLKFPEFNLANQQDFIANRYPRLLLYESAVEAALYLKDDERIATFRGICKEEADAVLGNTTSRYTDRTSKRNKD
jgi:hypothetical protein